MRDDIAQIVGEIRGYGARQWDQMPDIELYMDQVITYLKRQLALFQGSSDTNIITPAIINNYVKDGIIERPVKKKYARSQLADLTAACILKRVLPMQSIKEMLVAARPEADVEKRYADFSEALGKVLTEETDLLEARGVEASGNAQLRDLAQFFAMRACVDCLIADKLLASDPKEHS